MSTTSRHPCQLSLLIPVYNEAHRLATGLTQALKYLNKQPYHWELIVINDGSTDTTDKLLKNYQPSIKIITSRKNYGKGNALRLGVKVATGKHIFFSDIDFSVPIKFVPIFLKSLKHNDLVIGSRRLRKSRVIRHQDQLRESLGHGFTKLSNFILGLNHTDLTCGFKGFNAPVAKKLFRLSRLNGWAFDSEILFLAHTLKYSVKEIPVTWKNDPRTKVKLFPDLLKSFFSLFYIRLIHG